MTPSDSTTPYPTSTWIDPKAYLALTATLVVVFGTGGSCTKEYVSYKKWREAGSSALHNDAPDVTSAAAEIDRDLEHIRSSLKFSLNDIARCVGVSRQTIYNWKSGAEIKAENAVKLERLKETAAIIATANLPPSPLLFQRTLPGGQTLVEAIRAGRDSKEVATTFVAMLNGEARRRAELTAKFARIRPVSESIPDDAPLIFDERG